MSEFELSLKDAFALQGNMMEDFEEVTKMMAENTKSLIVRPDEVTFLSLCNVEEMQRPGKVVFYILSAENLEDFMLHGKALHVGTISEEKIGAELLEEMRRTTGLMAIINREKFLVSQIAMPTLTIQSMVSGTATINRNNLYRDMHIADALIARNEKVHFVYRECEIGKGPDGSPVIVKKIFAALGRYFSPCEQTVLCKLSDLIKKENLLGHPEVRFWKVDHEFTELYLEFPKAAEEFKTMYKLKSDIMPGIYMCTSDTGSSSVICRGVYSTGGRSYVITDEVRSKHTGALSPESMLEQVDEHIFANIRLLPEALMKLMGETVTDPAWDLSTESGSARNYAAVSKKIESIAKDAFKKILPVKRLKSLIECMQDEINSGLVYTLYDIAVDFMSVPERVEGLDATTLTEIRKACAKVPFALAKKTKTKEEKEEEIFLIPA